MLHAYIAWDLITLVQQAHSKTSLANHLTGVWSLAASKRTDQR
jgi:hypothetical protein